MLVLPSRLPLLVALVATLASPTLAAPTASLATDQASYARGQAIRATFTGGPGHPKDWIGIYQLGQVPGQVASTLWAYVGGSRSPGAGLAAGTVEFGAGSPGWPLGSGTWVAYLLEDDGYTILATTRFTVERGVQSVLSTSRTIYAPGESIAVAFSGGPGSPRDWIGIYPDGVSPGQAGATLWLYAGGAQVPGASLTSGTVTFGGGAGGAWPLPAGRWKAFLLADDGYAVLAYAAFWVGDERAQALTPGGWLLAPAGQQSLLGSGPLAMALTPDGQRLVVANGGYDHHSLMLVEAATGRVLHTLPGIPDGEGSLYLGLVLSRDGRTAYASDGTNSTVRIFGVEPGRLVERDPIALPAGTWPAGLALTADQGRLLVAGNLSDSLLVVDLAQRAVVASAPVGHRPYGVALSRDGQRAYLSNWGADTVSVARADTATPLGEIPVGMHPSALLQHPGRDELYVACSDSDEVAVIDSRSSTAARRISLRPWPGAPVSASPNALALSPDGQTLFVANAGDNDVAQVRLAPARRPGQAPVRGGERRDAVDGLIPTAWFPSAIAVDPATRTLLVANMKGLGVGPVRPGGYIADQLTGTLSRIPLPGEGELERLTVQVVRNDRFPGGRADEAATDGAGHRRPDAVDRVLGAAPGHPSPIRHVIYVLKENRTYDQVLGDLGRGNGDPSLAIFGESVTPNHHELARRFVTLDNFYCEGEVSADGWIWSSAASANTYNQKNWPLDYGWAGRLYDFGGFGDNESAGFPGTDPLRAFLWDRLGAAGLSYRNYGFFVNGLSGTPPMQRDLPASMPGLQDQTDLLYSGWDMGYPDVERLEEWRREFRQFVASGDLPRVQFVYLPRDHTVGTATGADSPQAMVADNDLALGRLVDDVSHSPFWKETAIFVLEDDAQDGPDHVDGHRSVALVVSPYTQRGTVDSTRYSTVSALRTMELILGIEPLTKYDALATPMRASFTARPDFRPYQARTPAVALRSPNPAGAPLAAASRALDFSRPDAADRRVLNEAIWRSVKGGGSAMPAPRTTVAVGP